MNSSAIGSKPFRSFANFKNAETSAQIVSGKPVMFVMNGTDDGYAGVLPSTGGNAKAILFMGVNEWNVNAGDQGSVQVFGQCNYAIVAQQTRSASSVSWATAASLSIGQPLTINTVVDAFVALPFTGAPTVAISTGAATSDTLGVAAFLPFAVMAQTLTTAAGSATATSDTRLAVTYGLKILLRVM